MACISVATGMETGLVCAGAGSIVRGLLFPGSGCNDDLRTVSSFKRFPLDVFNLVISLFRDVHVFSSFWILCFRDSLHLVHLQPISEIKSLNGPSIADSTL